MKPFVPLVALVASVLFLTGCSSIKVARYDTTTRPPATELTVFDTEAQAHATGRSYKVIALLTREAHLAKEASTLQMFINTGRKLGADAIIRLTPRDTGMRADMWGAAKGRPIFACQAIKYSAP